MMKPKGISEKMRDILYVFVFTCIVGIFFYPVIFSGKLPVPGDALVGLYHPFRDKYAAEYPNGIPFKNFLITDPVRQQIPWRKSAVDAIRLFRLPAWDAWTFSGTRLLANIQSGALYPLNFLFLIFPFAVAWTLLIISQPLLSGIFLYLFLRSKKLDGLPSLFGAVTFAFSGFSIAWLTWGTILSAWLWTPLSLLAVEKTILSSRRARVWWSLILIFSVTSSFFAGHTQIFLYSVAVITLYVLYDKRRRYAVLHDRAFLFIGGVIILTTMPVWRPLIDWLPQTGRLADVSSWKTEGFFIPARQLIQFLVPDYFGNPATLNYWGIWNYGEMVGYIGIGGILFAMLGMSLQTLFWTVLALGALIFAVGSPFSHIPFQLHIPVISSLQPTRLLVVADFCLSVLAAYGLTEIIRIIRKKSVFLTLTALGIIFILLWISISVPALFGIMPADSAVARRNLILPTVLFLFTAVGIVSLRVLPVKFRRRYSVIFSVIIIAFVIFDLFRFGWKFTPFTDSRYFFPSTKILSFLTNQTKPFRIMSTDDRILPPDVNEYYGIESVAGYDPVHALRYEEFIAAMERNKPDITAPFGFNRIISPKNVKSPLIRLLDVKYVLSFDDLSSSGFSKILQEGSTILYENTNHVPRVHLVEQVTVETVNQRIINALYDPAFDPATRAIVEKPLHVLNLPLTMSESVSVDSYKVDTMKMKVITGQPRVLFIGNMFDPGWRAYVDGKSTGIIRTDYLFMGVVVPEGAHTITLTYH